MPAEGAFKLLERVRQSTSGSDSRTLAIGLSTLGGAPAERRALSAGFDAVLQKPFGPADWIQLLDRLLQR